MNCTDCGTALKPRKARKGTLCQKCNGRATIQRIHGDPALVAKKLAGIQERYERPGERQRMADMMRGMSKALWADPEQAERWRQKGVILAERTVLSDACKKNAASPEARAKANKTRAERWMDWCPVDRRDEYRSLIKRHGFTREEAKQIILNQIEREASRVVNRIAAEMHAKEARRVRDAY